MDHFQYVMLISNIFHLYFCIKPIPFFNIYTQFFIISIVKEKELGFSFKVLCEHQNYKSNLVY